MKLIAYVGPKGSGKDTCALIAKEAGIVAGKIPFAGPLKRICSDVFGIPLDTFEHPVWKEEPGLYILLPTILEGIYRGMRNYLPVGLDEVVELGSCMQPHTNKVLSSPRHVLQYVGTEIIRSFDTDWHCKAAFSERHLNELGLIGLYGTYAVTDCRFLNEYEFLSKQHDTQFIYVSRPEAEARLAEATHASELEIKEVKKLIPTVLNNTGTLADLDVLVKIFYGE